MKEPVFHSFAKKNFAENIVGLFKNNINFE